MSSSSEITDAAHVQYMGSYVSRNNMPTPPTPKFRLPPSAAPFHIPPLHSSFPSLLHPHYELVKQRCDGWILEVAQPPSAAACRLLLDCVLPRLICRAIPAASSSVPRLIHVTKMISWLTIADDEDDHPDVLGADHNTSAQHGNRVMAILRCQDHEDIHEPTRNALTASADPEAGQTAVDSGVPLYASCNKSERKERALEALSKLWAEMRREMTPGVRDRFVLTMEDYLQAVKVQATFRRMHRLPDMQAYMEIRRQASFILPCFALLEYALGIELEEAAYNSPSVRTFRTLALDYICLCNDLISCKAEIGVGDYFNMPSIAYSSNKDWSFQEAIDHVATMIQGVDGQCVSMLHESSSLSLQQLGSANTYIAALCSCMSGSLAWFLETARYRNSAS